MEQLIDESNALMAKLEFSVEETADQLEKLIKRAWKEINPIVKCQVCGFSLGIVTCEVGDEYHVISVRPCGCRLTAGPRPC